MNEAFFGPPFQREFVMIYTNLTAFTIGTASVESTTRLKTISHDSYLKGTLIVSHCLELKLLASAEGEQALLGFRRRSDLCENSENATRSLSPSRGCRTEVDNEVQVSQRQRRPTVRVHSGGSALGIKRYQQISN